MQFILVPMVYWRACEGERQAKKLTSLRLYACALLGWFIFMTCYNLYALVSEQAFIVRVASLARLLTIFSPLNLMHIMQFAFHSHLQFYIICSIVVCNCIHLCTFRTMKRALEKKLLVLLAFLVKIVDIPVAAGAAATINSTEHLVFST